MEIYLWSRDDARRTSPAHGLAAKIHLLDRAASNGGPGENPDPFVLTWSGPRDKAVFDRLQAASSNRAISTPAPSPFSGRAELRDALRGVSAGSFALPGHGREVAPARTAPEAVQIPASWNARAHIAQISERTMSAWPNSMTGTGRSERVDQIEHDAQARGLADVALSGVAVDDDAGSPRRCG